MLGLPDPGSSSTSDGMISPSCLAGAQLPRPVGPFSHEYVFFSNGWRAAVAPYSVKKTGLVVFSRICLNKFVKVRPR